MTDRWTAETEELVTRALMTLTPPPQHGQLCPVWTRRGSGDAVCDCWIERKARQRANPRPHALADAGLLLAPGGETREEIEVQTAALRYPCGDMERAWLRFGELMAKGWGPVKIVKRTVHIGPWLPVSDGGGA